MNYNPQKSCKGNVEYIFYIQEEEDTWIDPPIEIFERIYKLWKYRFPMSLYFTPQEERDEILRIGEEAFLLKNLQQSTSKNLYRSQRNSKFGDYMEI
jgi:hypothetical protein